MAEIAPSTGGGANRTFLIIIGGLAALLFIGLLALGALFILPNLFGGPPSVAQITPTPTRIVIPPTATRAPQPTATLVIAATVPPSPTPTEAAPTATPTPEVITATPIPITATPAPTEEQLPESGLGENLVLLVGGALLLLGVIVAVRLTRHHATD